MFQGGSHMTNNIIATSMLEQKVSYRSIKVSCAQAGGCRRRFSWHPQSRR
jgi:hypothetical protein